MKRLTRSIKLKTLAISVVIVIVGSIQIASLASWIVKGNRAKSNTVVLSERTEANTGEPERIRIESVGIDLPIVSVPLVDGTWQVYENKANYAQGTSLISNTGGNIGIYGHDKENVFAAIKKLSIGDKIWLYSGNYQAVYIVEQAFVSDPNKVEIFSQTDEPYLTLVTCQGVFAQQRYVVRAKLTDINNI